MRLERLTPTDLPVSVGPWRLVVAVGERSDGRVFRVESDGSGGLPGRGELTVVSPALLVSPGTRDEVVAELDLARSLVHPGIVRTFSCGEHRGTPWYVTEPGPVASLHEMVRGTGALTPRQALDMGVQVAAALAHAHGGGGRRPLLHRGLRPSRILVGADGKVQLRGFGLGGLPASVGRGAGQAGPWSSPEQIGRRRLGPSSDLFAVGAVLYFAITGRQPFRVQPGAVPSERVGEIVRVLARGEIFRRLDRRAQGLGGLFQRLLAVDPSARYTDAGQLEQAMRQLRAGLPTGEGIGALAARAAADHAGTVALDGPTPGLSPERELVELDDGPEPSDGGPTDADFDLPSSRASAEGDDRIRGPVLAGAVRPDDLEETRPGAVSSPAVAAESLGAVAAPPPRAAPPRPAPRCSAPSRCA